MITRGTAHEGEGVSTDAAKVFIVMFRRLLVTQGTVSSRVYARNNVTEVLEQVSFVNWGATHLTIVDAKFSVVDPCMCDWN